MAVHCVQERVRDAVLDRAALALPAKLPAHRRVRRNPAAKLIASRRHRATGRRARTRPRAAQATVPASTAAAAAIRISIFLSPREPRPQGRRDRPPWKRFPDVQICEPKMHRSRAACSASRDLVVGSPPAHGRLVRLGPAQVLLRELPPASLAGNIDRISEVRQKSRSNDVKSMCMDSRKVSARPSRCWTSIVLPDGTFLNRRARLRGPA